VIGTSQIRPVVRVVHGEVVLEKLHHPGLDGLIGEIVALK